MSTTPATPPGTPVPRPATGDPVAAWSMGFGILFLLLGLVGVAWGAGALALGLHSPKGEPIMWAGAIGLATGVALFVIARLRPQQP